MRVTVKISICDKAHADHDHFEVVVDDTQLTCDPGALGPALELMFAAAHQAAYGHAPGMGGDDDDDEGEKWKKSPA